MPSFFYERFDGLNGLDALKTEWDTLFAKMRDQNPFFSFDWIKIWLVKFLNDRPLLIYLFKDSEGETVCILPLVRDKQMFFGMKMDVLWFPANSHSFRSGLLLSSNGHEADLLKFIFRTLLKEESFHILKFREYVPADGLQRLLREQNLHYSLEELKQPPLIEISGSWDDYFASRKGHFRRNLRRRLRNAQKEFGHVDYKVFDAQRDDIRAWLDKGFELEALGWKGDQGSAILSNQETEDFYKKVARHFQQSGHFYSGGVYFGDKLVAFNFSLIYDGVFYLLKVAYDESFSRYSPGQIMMYFVLQEVFDKQLRCFDFLGPSMPWKLEWADKWTDQYTFYLYHSTFKSFLFYWFNTRLLTTLRKNKLLKKIRGKLR